jgi:hypothetical protein
MCRAARAGAGRQGGRVPSEYETLRWPTNLDRAAIVQRLVQLREAARANGVADLAARFSDVEHMPAAQIGASVVAALNWVQDKPQHRGFAAQLEMVAMNLKNLR